MQPNPIAVIPRIATSRPLGLALNWRRPLATLLLGALLFQWGAPVFAETTAAPAIPGGSRSGPAPYSTTTSSESTVPLTPATESLTAESAGGAMAMSAGGGSVPQSPTATFSVQSFQADLFSGAATAEIPILLPPGTAGAAPKVALRYHSGTVDDLRGTAETIGGEVIPPDQAPWTGLGWSLETGGFLLRDNKRNTDPADDTFTLVFGGAAHPLVRAQTAHPIYTYHTQDETFWRIVHDASQDTWTLTTKDGTAHLFGTSSDSRAVMYYNASVSAVYKYLLKSVATTSGTEVQYAYYSQKARLKLPDGTLGAEYDQAFFLDSITYTYHNGSAVDPLRRVRFLRDEVQERQDYTDTSAHIDGKHAAFFGRFRLKEIEVSLGTQVVRRYVLTHDTSVDRDPAYTWGEGATGDLTLKSVQVFDSTGASLPAMEFTYAGAHLETVKNGMGGEIRFAYERIATVPIRYAFTDEDCYHDVGVVTHLLAPPAKPACESVLYYNQPMWAVAPIGFALATQLPGTIPLYRAVKGLSAWGTGDVDWGVSLNGDPADRLGYVFPYPFPGNLPLGVRAFWESTDFIPWGGGYACVDYAAASQTFPAISCLVDMMGYLYAGRVDRSRVSSRTIRDGVNPDSITTYAYQDLGLSPDGKEFRGHRWVKATGPTGDVTETWFHQDGGLQGRPEWTETRRGTDQALFTRVAQTWTAVTPAPGVTFARLDRTDVATCDGDATCPLTRQEFAYDGYGNVTVVAALGDPGVSGDDRIDVTEYAVNEAAYLVGLPAQTYTLDAEGFVVALAWLYYDGATNHATPPTQGRLTARCRWLEGGTSPCEQFAYDTYGNLTRRTDPEGHATTIQYAPPLFTFPQAVAAPPTANASTGLQTATEYDPRFGVLLRATDPNGQTTTHEYDPFGRLWKTTDPLGRTTRTVTYALTGGVGAQHIRTERPGGLWTAEYLDGLGRPIEVRRQAAGGQVVVARTAYDAHGRVACRTLPVYAAAAPACQAGNSTSYAYDPLGRPHTTTFPDGSTEQWTYNDRVVTRTDRNNQRWTSQQDAHGRLVQVAEPNDALTRYRYDALGRLTRVTNALGHVTSMAYDTLGRKVRMTEPNMGTWTYRYDGNNNLLAQTDAKGQTLQFAYDALNRPTATVYPGTPAATAPTITGLTADKIAPQSVNTPIAFTVAATGGTSYETRWGIYDGQNWTMATSWQPTMQFAWTPTHANSAYSVGVQVRLAGELGNNPVSFTSMAYPIDPGTAQTAPFIWRVDRTPLDGGSVGNASTFNAIVSGGTGIFESRWGVSQDGGFTWTIERPWAAGTTFAWTPTDGNPDTWVGVEARHAGTPGDDPRRTYTFSYPIGASPLAAPTIVSLTADNQPNSPAGTPIVFSLAATGGIEPYETRWWVYDGSSWTVVRWWEEGTAYSWTPTVGNSAYQVGVEIRNAGTPGDSPANSVIQSFPIAISPPPPTITGLTANLPSGQPAGTPITFTLAVTGKGGLPADYETHWGIFDGTTWTIVRPWAGGTSLTWTPRQANPNYTVGVEVRKAGDPADRLAAFAAIPFAVTGGGGGTVVTTTYDTGPYGKGRRTALTDLAGQTTWAYDALGRLVASSRTTGNRTYVQQVLEFTALDQPRRVQYPDGEVVEIGYDAAGQPTSLTSITHGTVYVAGATYTPDGQLQHLTYGSGVVTSHEYSPTTLRLHTLKTTQGGTTHQDFTYGYDAAGNVTALTDARDPGNSQTFLYDPLGRLTTAAWPGAGTTQGFGYDALGNLTEVRLGSAGSDPTVRYTYHSFQTPHETCGRPMPHAVVQTEGPTGTARFSYDCNGNLVADGERTVTWDPDNRPVAVERAGVGLTTFAYGGDGGRVLKATPGGDLVHYAGDFEDHNAGQVQVKHLRLGGRRVAARVTGGANPGLYPVLPDHLGGLHVLLWVDPATGVPTEVQRLTYQPFGATRTTQGTRDFYPHRFTGQALDPETGLYFYQARYYNPALGRFLSPDPLVPAPGDPQSLNRYSYVNNNPVTLVDPSGHFSLKAFLRIAIPIVTVVASLWAGAADFSWAIPGIAAGGSAAQTAVNGGSGSQILGAALVGGLAAGVGMGVSGAVTDWAVPFTSPAIGTGLGTVAGAASGGFVQGFGSAMVMGAGPDEAFRRGYQTAAVAAGVAGIASVARAYYEQTCGYGPDPRPGIAERPDGTYEKNPVTHAPRHARVLAVGANNAEAGWYGQGGLVGSLGRIPLLNAFGVLHDAWVGTYGWSSISVASQATWLPALVVSEAALLANPFASLFLTQAMRKQCCE